MDEIQPELTGPYDEEVGRCAFGHPVNAWGRCEPLNTGTEDVVSSDNGEVPGEAGD